MGRQAPDPQYKIINCDAQTSTGSYSGYAPTIISGGQFVFHTLFPPGSSGSGAAVNTGTMAIGTGIGAYMPYVNGCLVGVNDENRAIVDCVNVILDSTDDSNIYNYPQFNYRFYNSYSGVGGFSAATVATGNFALKVTGASIQKQQGQIGGVLPAVRQIVDYIDIDSNFSLFTTYVNSPVSGSGNTVGVTLVEHTSSGAQQRFQYDLPDTLNSTAPAVVSCCFPSLAKDTNSNRFVIGYQSATGITSGQLCVSVGEVDTASKVIQIYNTGVVRSVVGTGIFGQTISVTCHSGVASTPSFVIATTVQSPAATTYSNSGQLLAANPIQGDFEITGYYGTPVSIFNTSSGGSSTLYNPICTAFNNTGNSVSGSFGLVIGVTGTASGLPVSGTRQVYRVSGRTITTGVISDFPHALDSSGVIIGTGLVRAFHKNGSVGNRNPNRLVEVPSTVSASGLVSYLSYAFPSGTSQTITGVSGTAYINYLQVPYSLTNTGFTQYITLTGSITSGFSYTANRLASGSSFLRLTNNPYNGVHGSFIFLNGDTTSLSLGSLATTTGYFPSGIAAANSGIFGGSLFQGLLRPDYVTPYNTLRFRSYYTITSGITSYTDGIRFYASGSQNPWATGTPTPVKLKGTYPNYTGMVVIHNDAIYDIALPSVTGEQIYTLFKNAFKTPLGKGVTSTAQGFVSRIPESLGIVVNPSTTLTGNKATIDSGMLSTTTVPIKVALTETAKRNLLKDCVKTFTIVENHTIFE